MRVGSAVFVVSGVPDGASRGSGVGRYARARPARAGTGRSTSDALPARRAQPDAARAAKPAASAPAASHRHPRSAVPSASSSASPARPCFDGLGRDRPHPAIGEPDGRQTVGLGLGQWRGGDIGANAAVRTSGRGRRPDPRITWSAAFCPAPIGDRGAPAPSAVPLPAPVRLVFEEGQAELTPVNEAAIMVLAKEIPTPEADSVNVLAYAAGKPDDPSTARRLSLSRGMAVRSVLLANGVPSARIYVRALGATATDGPADRVELIVARNRIGDAMTRPNTYLIRMAVFLVLVAAVVGVLSPVLWEIFWHNPGLNGLILLVLATGIGWNLRQVHAPGARGRVAGTLPLRHRTG